MNEDASTLGALGEACSRDEECAEGICLSAGRCSRACSSGTDCPDSPWTCVSLPGRGAICDCTPSDREVACNDLDDDCDALTDETSIDCGGVCVDGAQDPANCGGCGVACGGGSACEDGSCACPTARPDICGTACVNVESDVANCGSCGTVCTADAPATAVCVEGACALDCPPDSGDCDGDPTNGCEADTSSDELHCGGCDMPCAFTNATGTCTAGSCRVDACDAGFGDCDSDGVNGCEADLTADLLHCTACNLPCDPANATGRCAAGGCELVACESGFSDCDGLVGSGCEVDTRTNASNCGTCGRVCPGSGRPNTLATCAAAACSVSCVTGYGDCDGTLANGCETPVSTSIADCGTCGNACALGEVCSAGSCTSRRFTGMTGPAWEVIAAGGGVNYPGYSDYSPAGSELVFAQSGSTTPRFARLGSGLTWTTLGPPADRMEDGYFAGPAWVGGYLYSIAGDTVARYDIAAASWTNLTSIARSSNSQAVHDDAGHVYVITADGEIATYDIAANAVSYQPAMTAVIGARIAWDSLSRLLFLAPDYRGTSFYSFDPATGMRVTLPSLPAMRFTPTFCSDRSGHVYAAGDNSGTLIWQYDIATATWATLPVALPFDHNANGACTVTDSGWLYVTDTGARLARIRLL